MTYATHRYFMEPLTELQHVRRILFKRYLKFIRMIRDSGKGASVQLLDLVQSDVRTTTGQNLRRIMLEAGKNKTTELFAGDVDFKYHNVPEDEAWRVDFLKEIIEIKHGELEVSGFTEEELIEIQDFLCTK